MPSLEEHLRVSLISCGYAAVACAFYVGLGEDATKEAFEWVASFPEILKSCSIICRLMDDITSHEVKIFFFLLFFLVPIIYFDKN